MRNLRCVTIYTITNDAFEFFKMLSDAVSEQSV